MLYLIRHAHALDAADDTTRPLSARGEKQVRALAGFLRKSGVFQPEEIWHSPLVRSRQTAELLARRLKIVAPLILTPGLEPGDDPRIAARRIRTTPRAIAVVGHEPHLGLLASLLVTGKMEPVRFVMKKCAILALEGAAGHWRVRWHVSPEVMG